jgi:hypothetical protein
MKCAEIENLMEDYHYGELNEKLTLQVEAHLAGCPGCSRILESLQAEDGIYREYKKVLDRALEVHPSSWDKIRVKAAARSRLPAWTGLSQAFKPYAIAQQALFASILVLISVSATLWVVRHFDERRTVAIQRSYPNQIRPVEPKDLETAILSIQKAEQEYIRAIQILDGIVEKRRSTLNPVLAAELERNLKAVDELVASTRKAYHAHPADPELAHYMLAAYKKKVDLLQELAS